MPLTIVAHITAVQGQEEFMFAELKKIIATTRSESGCLQYDLHRDNDDPAHFMFFENWESREQWQDHMNAPHLAAYKAATKDALADFTLHEMTKIN